MVFLDGPAAAEKSDEENDASDHHQQHGSVEEGVAQEIQIVAVHALDHTSGHNQGQAGNLKVESLVLVRYPEDSF